MTSYKVFLDFYAGAAPVSRCLEAKGYAVLRFVLRGGIYDLSRRAVLATILGWMAAGLVWAVIVALSNRLINQIKPDQQSRQKVLRAYCYDIYVGFRNISLRQLFHATLHFESESFLSLY